MILVTGATGTIGSHVVAELARAHVPARALVRATDRGAQLPDGIEPVVGDLESLDATALDGVESVFLMSPTSPDTTRIESAAIDAARRAGVELIVKLGAAGASAQSAARFTRGHGEVIDYLRSSGVPSTVLMPTDYMANVLNQSQAIRETGTLYASDADALVASVHPADVGAVAAVALQGGHEGDDLVLTGPEAASARDVAARLSSVLGREIQLVVLDDDAMLTGMLGAGVPEWVAQGLLELYAAYRAGVAAETTGTVEAVLGRAPRSWDDFLRESSGAF